MRHLDMYQLCSSKRSTSMIKYGVKKTIRTIVRSFQPAFSTHEQNNFQEDRHQISDIAVGPGPRPVSKNDNHKSQESHGRKVSRHKVGVKRQEGGRCRCNLVPQQAMHVHTPPMTFTLGGVCEPIQQELNNILTHTVSRFI
jgi:hypothetical protein